MTEQSDPSNPDIPQAISAVMGIHVLAIEWLCEQLSRETGGTPMQWKVSAFTHGCDRFDEISPEALKAVTIENLAMAEQVLKK